jgi:multidrug transporter EmrE-like cation transporter
MKVMLAALLSICFSVAAQFLLKAGVAVMKADAGSDASAPWWLLLSNVNLIAGFGLYGAGAVVWLYVLSHWDVSKAYPLVGFGFVLTAAVGYWMAQEQVSALRLAGILLICAGVVLVARS